MARLGISQEATKKAGSGLWHPQGQEASGRVLTCPTLDTILPTEWASLAPGVTKPQSERLSASGEIPLKNLLKLV